MDLAVRSALTATSESADITFWTFVQIIRGWTSCTSCWGQSRRIIGSCSGRAGCGLMSRYRLVHEANPTRIRLVGGGLEGAGASRIEYAGGVVNDFEIRLKQCQTDECTSLATWELWTVLTYHYFCDAHRREPDVVEVDDGWEIRHRTEGVLDTGGFFAVKDTFGS